MLLQPIWLTLAQNRFQHRQVTIHEKIIHSVGGRILVVSRESGSGTDLERD
jgi:hypothetical protein